MQGNVMTEYEEKFSSMGNPICKLICPKQEWIKSRRKARGRNIYGRLN